jgi:hypothetical protein
VDCRGLVVYLRGLSWTRRGLSWTNISLFFTNELDHDSGHYTPITHIMDTTDPVSTVSSPQKMSKDQRYRAK